MSVNSTFIKLSIYSDDVTMIGKNMRFRLYGKQGNQTLITRFVNITILFTFYCRYDLITGFNSSFAYTYGDISVYSLNNFVSIIP